MVEKQVDTVKIRDTLKIYISRLDDITRTFGMTFDEFAKEFFLQKEQHDTAKIYSPEMIYLNYFLPMLQNKDGSKSKRAVSTIFTFELDKRSSINTVKLPDSIDIENYDILFRCGNSLTTDYFLTSPNLVDQALIELFGYIDEFNSNQTKKIKGVNFDFSEFQFHEKRAMAQFAKSTSLIIDSIHLKSIQNIRLYFSFDKTLGEINKHYLYSVSGMLDSIFLLEKGSLNPVKIITTKQATDLPLYAKIVNQFYLARFFLQAFPVTGKTGFSPEDIKKLAHADYADNNWEYYLFALLGIILISLVVFAIYWLVPDFSYYLDRNRDFMFMLLLMAGFEILILLFGMVDAMSREDIVNFSGENKDLLLFLPLVFVFVIPIFKAIGRRKEKP